MYTLDDEFNKSFGPNRRLQIECEHDDIFLIKNFFESPELVLEFQKKVNKWKTNSFGTLKPGIESYLPPWIPNVILENLNRKLNLNPDYKQYSCQVNFNYFFNSEDLDKNKDLRTKCILPHTDEVFKSDSKTKVYIFLLNLNKSLVTTKFWKFRDKKYEETEEERFQYCDYVKENSSKDSINNEDLQVYYECKYDFNTAILYPANMYHSPYIDKEYTIESPRIMFRIQYVAHHKTVLNYK